MPSVLTLKLPSEIGDRRVDTLMRALSLFEDPVVKEVHLNWQRVTMITPAGFAILACLFDCAVEQKKILKNTFVKKKLQQNPVVQNLLRQADFSILPQPKIHAFASAVVVLDGGESAINITFVENMLSFFASQLSEDLQFSCQLAVNELMQNCVAHSSSERYYLYAGPWGNEFHVGVLDMGCTIPAKLQQKYTQDSDLDYLALSLKEGVTTRRQRQGGLGLSHIFDILKNCGGKLTLISRNAQIRRYFGNRVVQRMELKNTLHGTWCFARFPLEGH
jgi:anti-sigma regulatory factor (Ser/Thr protein kinase)